LIGLFNPERFLKVTAKAKTEALADAFKYMEQAVMLLRNKHNLTEHFKVYKTLRWRRVKSLQFQKAETAFTRAYQFQIDPNGAADETVLTFLWMTQFLSHKLTDALATFSRCEDQSQTVLPFNIDRCNEQLNPFSEARRIYIALHNLHPQFPEPLFRLSALALRDTRPHDVNPLVMQYFQAIIEEIDHNNVRPLLELHNVADRAGQFREARQSMERAEEKASGGDGYIDTTISIAKYLLESAQTKTEDKERTNRLDYAQRNFMKALKRNHGCIFAVNGMALCWLLAGHVSEAKERLVLVKDYRPDLASSWENLGLAYMKEHSHRVTESHGSIGTFRRC
jgi:tetratricopeptide (TPR) repeat protein